MTHFTTKPFVFIMPIGQSAKTNATFWAVSFAKQFWIFLRGVVSRSACILNAVVFAKFYCLSYPRLIITALNSQNYRLAVSKYAKPEKSATEQQRNFAAPT